MTSTEAANCHVKDSAFWYERTYELGNIVKANSTPFTVFNFNAKEQNTIFFIKREVAEVGNYATHFVV